MKALGSEFPRFSQPDRLTNLLQLDCNLAREHFQVARAEHTRCRPQI